MIERNKKLDIEWDGAYYSISAEEDVELLDRPIWENAGTGVEQIQPSFDNKTYGVKKLQLQSLMDKNVQEGLNDTHTYMNVAVNIM